jgi:hypothetical protein
VKLFITVCFVGVGATAIVDLWSILRRAFFDIPEPNYGLVGRWVAHMKRGRFQHESIAAATGVSNERLIGWIAHYFVGILFAAALIVINGTHWVRQPTFTQAFIFGVGTVVAPFLLMQPGMGAGIAASRTARPAVSRLQSLITHAVFGIGLYAAAFAANYLFTIGE